MSRKKNETSLYSLDRKHELFILRAGKGLNPEGIRKFHNLTATEKEEGKEYFILEQTEIIALHGIAAEATVNMHPKQRDGLVRVTQSELESDFAAV